MLLKVRPFPKQRTTYDSSVEMAGTIESGQFVLSVDDIPYSIDAVEFGIDDRGAYAVVEEGRQLLLGGWVLCIEAEQSAVRAPAELSCEITFRKQPDRVRLDKALAELGIEPREAAALFKIGQGAIAISFDPDGVFESAIAVLGRQRS